MELCITFPLGGKCGKDLLTFVIDISGGISAVPKGRISFALPNCGSSSSISTATPPPCMTLIWPGSSLIVISGARNMSSPIFITIRPRNKYTIDVLCGRTKKKCITKNG